MIEQLGFPHPGPLPVGEGVHGVSLTASTLLLASMPLRDEGSGGSDIAPHGPMSSGWSDSKYPQAARVW